MASTYSQNLKIELIGTGEQAGAWGTTTNTNLGTAVEEAIAGYATANFTSDADLTLTLTNSNATQVARHFALNVTSGVSLTTTRNLVVPTIEKPYVVKNATTGGQSIVVKTSAGSGVTVGNGLTAWLYVDGTNVVQAMDSVSGAALVNVSATQTLTNKTLTSPAITGGTINNTVIGGTTRAAGNFTTLDANGNVTLGDASTDTVTVNGYMGVGGAANPSNAIRASSTGLTTVSIHGFAARTVAPSTATTSSYGFSSLVSTAAASFTMSEAVGFHAFDATKGAGSTITNQHGVQIADQTQGTNNFGITSLVSSGTNKWNIYASGTAANYFAGNVLVGTPSSATPQKILASTGLDTDAGNISIGLGSVTDSTRKAVFTKNTTSPFELTIQSSVGGTAGPIIFKQTSSTEAMRIDSSGNVGIGTSAPGARLDVWGDAASSWNALQLINTAESSTVDIFLGRGTTRRAFVRAITSTTAAGNPTALAFGTNVGGADGTERLRIDSSGNVGIGTSSPVLVGTLSREVSVSSTTAGSIVGFNLQGNRATNGDGLGVVSFFNGSDRAASIAGLRGANSNDGQLTFSVATAGTVTERLRIDASGNVGIGTSSPGARLSVISSDPSGTGAQFFSSASGSTAIVLSTNFDETGRVVTLRAGFTGGTPPALAFNTGSPSTERLRIDSSGQVGIGVTPSPWITSIRAVDVSSASAFWGYLFGGTAPRTLVSNNAYLNSAGNYIYKVNGDASEYRQMVGQHQWHTAPSGTAGNAISFTQAMTLDASGNLGIGVTPGTWGGTGARALELGIGSLSESNNAIHLTHNARFNGTNWVYIAGAGATRYSADRGTGSHSWSYAPTGTGGGSVTFTEAMRITNSGNVGIGTSSPGAPLEVRGTGNVLILSRNQLVGGGLGVGDITFRGRYDATSYGTAAQIVPLSVGTWSSTSTPSELSIRLTATDQTVPTERLRIDSSGNVGIGTSSPISKLQIGGGTVAEEVLNFAPTVGGGAAFGNTSSTGYFRFLTGTSGTPTERLRIDSSGNTLQTQPAPAAVNATATLTVANLRTRIITSTTAALVTGTLPTGTLMDSTLYNAAADMGYDWSVINTGANNFVVAAGATHTVVGNMTVTGGASGSFRSRRTAANTWITYRIG
jgi:hypothetical protein